MRVGSSTFSTTLERNELGRARRLLDLHHVACAEIVQRAHAAERGVGRILDREADEIGVIELVRLGRGQRLARHEQLAALERLRRIPVGDTLEAHDRLAGLARAQRADLQAAAVIRGQRSVSTKRVGIEP